jgi:hypothetical protein
MHNQWNGFPPPPEALAHHTTADTLLLHQLASRMDQLIRLMEQNNELLRSIEQQQSRVTTSGSGSVIVRM